MKSTLLFALLLGTAICVHPFTARAEEPVEEAAGETTSEQSGAAAPAVKNDLEAYVNAGNRVAEAMKELTILLRGVNSKESADAACAEVASAARKLVEVSHAAESLPAPSEELQTGLVEKLTESGFIDTTQEFLQALMVLAAHECYESAALQEALKVLDGTEPAN